MAYTVVMTKENVSQQGTLYNITIKCTVNDGTEDVFERSITKRYNPAAPNLDALKNEILSDFRVYWDQYMAEQNIAGSQAMTNALSDMQATATAYIN